MTILHLFDCVNQVASIDGNLKIQKLGFIFELKGLENNLRTAHYRFFRYNHGPYSKDLANDVTRLKGLGFLTKQSNHLTERGRFLLEYLRPYIESNEPSATAAKILGEVCREYGKFSGPQLKRKVYQMTVPVIDYGNEPKKVADIPHFTNILDPLLDANLKEVAFFPEDVLADLRDEFAMSAEEIDPDSPDVQKTVSAILQRLPSLSATVCKPS